MRDTGRTAIVPRVILCSLILAFGSIAHALDVQTIQINAGIERTNGTLGSAPYYFDVTVKASDVTSIQLTTPAGCSFFLTEVADETWYLAGSGYTSLLDMRNGSCLGFGEFDLDFAGGASQLDAVTLAFDPGNSAPFTGYPAIAYPFHGEWGVSLEPLYSWSCTGSCGPGVWDLQVVEDLSGEWRYEHNQAPEVTQWNPGPLDPDTDYQFWVHTAELLAGGGPDATDGSDAFEYYPTFESFNEVWFTSLERIVLEVDPSELRWTALSAAFAYDVVQGDLALLTGSEGDFTGATTGCVLENGVGSPLAHGASPASAGEGWWYLVRGVGAAGGLSYESLVSAQVGARDAEIAAAGAACL